MNPMNPDRIGSTLMPSIEIQSAHKPFDRHWPNPPRVGDFLRITDDHLDRVIRVIWSDDHVIVEAECVVEVMG